MVANKMTEKQIDEALERGDPLWGLYKYQRLTEKQVDKALSIGKRIPFDLCLLYKYQWLTEKQIKEALEMKEFFYDLFKFQIKKKFTKRNLEKERQKRGIE